jgi:hypothetical protein
VGAVGPSFELVAAEVMVVEAAAEVEAEGDEGVYAPTCIYPGGLDKSTNSFFGVASAPPAVRGTEDCEGGGR